MVLRWRDIFKWVMPCVAIIALHGFSKTTYTDCDVYRKGKFYIYNKTSKDRIDIERRDSLQIETNTRTGIVTMMKINWTGPCEYELWFNYMTPKEVSKNKDVLKVFESSFDVPFEVKILSGTDSYYVFESSKKGFKNLRDTVWLVK